MFSLLVVGESGTVPIAAGSSGREKFAESDVSGIANVPALEVGMSLEGFVFPPGTIEAVVCGEGATVTG